VIEKSRSFLGVLFCILIFSLIIFMAIPTFATPAAIEQKKAEADRVKAQIEEMNRALEEAVEQYNSAAVKLEETQKAIEENRLKLEKAKEELAQNQRVLNERIAGIYKHGKVNFISVLLATKSFDNFLVRLDWLVRIGKQDLEVLRRIQRVKRQIEEIESKLEEEKRRRLALREELEAKRWQIEGQIRERRTFLSSVEEEIARLIREEEERQARLRAEALRRAQEEARQAAERRARESSEGRSSGNSEGEKPKKPEESKGSDPPANPSRGREVVSIAMKYIGAPYHWAGEGPGGCPTGEHSICFDCSGFTMYVYKQVGVTLPHSSAAQYHRGKPVSYDNLKPGDLVFFGRDGISHVGIYIGNGNFIHASTNGDAVKVQTLSSRSDYIGACRL